MTGDGDLVALKQIIINILLKVQFREPRLYREIENIKQNSLTCLESLELLLSINVLFIMFTVNFDVKIYFFSPLKINKSAMFWWLTSCPWWPWCCNAANHTSQCMTTLPLLVGSQLSVMLFGNGGDDSYDVLLAKTSNDAPKTMPSIKTRIADLSMKV